MLVYLARGILTTLGNGCPSRWFSTSRVLAISSIPKSNPVANTYFPLFLQPVFEGDGMLGRGSDSCTANRVVLGHWFHPTLVHWVLFRHKMHLCKEVHQERKDPMVWWKFPQLRYERYWLTDSNTHKMLSWDSHHNRMWTRRQRQHCRGGSHQGGVYTDRAHLLANPNKGRSRKTLRSS